MTEAGLTHPWLLLRRRLLYWRATKLGMSLTRHRKLFVAGIVVVLFVVVTVLLKRKMSKTALELKQYDFLSELTNEQSRRIDVMGHVVNLLPRRQHGYVQQLGDDSFRPWTLADKEDGDSAASTYQQQSDNNSNNIAYDMMDRDITWSEEWPGVEIDPKDSNNVNYPMALHYVWCGQNREFSFRHYLGLLSGLRVLKPLKIFFHYTHNQPVMDKQMYNSWFEEFKYFVPVMDMLHLSNTNNASCGSKAMLNTIVGLVSKHGGIYLGEKIVLAGLPRNLPRLSSWFAFADDDKDHTRGIIYVKQNIKAEPSKPKLHRGSACVSVDEFNDRGHGEDRKCVFITDRPKYPRDIWSAESHFAELARWLFYGRRKAFHVQRDPSNPIPRISHYIRVQDRNKPMYQEEFSFNHFISVLSALYVAGFPRVYLHVDKVPTGKWWDMLQKENITVLQLQKPDLVYQQKITGITHFSDVSRYNVLNRFGGVYQDFDCVWTTRVPDHILEYPTVVSPAISRNGQWPDGLAIGMLMSRARAPFLRHAFKGYRDYHGENYLYNAIMRSYRTYEYYPDILHFEPHFTLFCIDKRCLPTWPNHKTWDLTKDGGRGYNWSTEALALHMPKPKPVPSYASPEVLKKSQDLFGDVGRMVLEKSNRMYILG